MVKMQKIQLQKSVTLNNIYDLDNKLKNDFITYKHSTNVAHYSVQLLKNLNRNFDEALVYYSGLFHDVGKAQIESDILNKQADLCDDEFEIMKKHPSFGFYLLENAEFPKEVLDAALHHHERYDGNGYPYGLKADEIPFIARVVSICDVFDALTSDRPYRKAYSVEKAKKIMINSEGHFDPELFSVFISSI